MQNICKHPGYNESSILHLKLFFFLTSFFFTIEREPLYVVANVLDGKIFVSEFEPLLRLYIYIQTNNLWKSINSLILQVMDYILTLLFFKDSFGFK